MRCRTSGSSANCTISWISFLPPSSAGCALPAITSWIGRSGSSSSALEPLGVAQHQRQPLVRRHAAGEADRQHVGVEHVVDPAELGRRGAALQPRLRAAAPRASSTSRSRSMPLGRPRSSSPATLSTRVPVASASSTSVSAPCLASASSKTSRATQVGACTPLVIERDRHLVRVERRPQAVEHPAADLRRAACETPLARWREPEAHHRHVEHAGSPPS